MKKPRKHKKVAATIARRRERARKRHTKWLTAKRHELHFLGTAQRKEQRQLRQTIKESKNFEKILAPENFSLNENTDEVVSFVGKLERCYELRTKVLVNLKDVVSIDYGAIVALLAIMVQFKEKRIKFNGNFPKDHQSAEILRKSGFLGTLYQEPKKDQRFCISNGADNSVKTHGWTKVDPQLSAGIVQESAVTIWGSPRRCQGVQRCIGELMLNTNNHAKIGKKGVKNWWLYVNHDPKRRVVSFAFVDFGVGIFQSLSKKPVSSKFFGWIPKIEKLYALKERAAHGDHSKILELIMSGDFHRTVTGKYYRGKGLPGIAEALKRNQLSNLIILSNDALGYVSKGAYRKIDSYFNGTYVYWELNEKNESCK